MKLCVQGYINTVCARQHHNVCTIQPHAGAYAEQHQLRHNYLYWWASSMTTNLMFSNTRFQVRCCEGRHRGPQVNRNVVVWTVIATLNLQHLEIPNIKTTLQNTWFAERSPVAQSSLDQNNEAHSTETTSPCTSGSNVQCSMSGLVRMTFTAPTSAGNIILARSHWLVSPSHTAQLTGRWLPSPVMDKRERSWSCASA
jgi:hypothetical protein